MDAFPKREKFHFEQSSLKDHHWLHPRQVWLFQLALSNLGFQELVNQFRHESTHYPGLRVKERRSHLGRQPDRPAMAAATACQVAASNSQRGKTMQAMVGSTLKLLFVYCLRKRIQDSHQIKVICRPAEWRLKNEGSRINYDFLKFGRAELEKSQGCVSHLKYYGAWPQAARPQ